MDKLLEHQNIELTNQEQSQRIESKKIEYNQQEQLLKNQEAQKQNERKFKIQRLQKRTLRAKILKIVDELFNYQCPNLHLVKIDEFSKSQDEKIVQEKNEQYLKKLKNYDYFQKRPFIFSKYKQEEYVPSLQNIKYQQKYQPISTQQHHQQNVIKMICSQLTKNEILEIGEDPGYFIVQKHKKHQELLDHKKWDDETGFHQTTEQQQKQKINENAIQACVDIYNRGMKIIQQKTQQEQTPYNFEENFIEQRNQILIKKRNDIQKKHQEKWSEYEQRKELTDQFFYERIIRFRNETLKKNQKTDLRLKTQKKAQQENQQKNILQNFKRQLEDEFKAKKKIEQDEIYKMSTEIKNICKQKYAEKNKEKQKQLKQQKLIELKNTQQRIKEQKDLGKQKIQNQFQL